MNSVLLDFFILLEFLVLVHSGRLGKFVSEACIGAAALSRTSHESELAQGEGIGYGAFSWVYFS